MSANQHPNYFFPAPRVPLPGYICVRHRSLGPECNPWCVLRSESEERLAGEETEMVADRQQVEHGGGGWKKLRAGWKVLGRRLAKRLRLGRKRVERGAEGVEGEWDEEMMWEG